MSVDKPPRTTFIPVASPNHPKWMMPLTSVERLMSEWSEPKGPNPRTQRNSRSSPRCEPSETRFDAS